jgi:hypothetical protein
MVYPYFRAIFGHEVERRMAPAVLIILVLAYKKRPSAFAIIAAGSGAVADVNY